MDEEKLQKIEECIQLAEQLKNQLEENAQAFDQCFSHQVNDSYQRNSQEAIKQCDDLKKYLNQLQEMEQNKIIQQNL